MNFVDIKSGNKISASANYIINCTGPYSDNIRTLLPIKHIKKRIQFSAGTHLVFNKDLLGDISD